MAIAILPRLAAGLLKPSLSILHAVHSLELFLTPSVLWAVNQKAGEPARLPVQRSASLWLSAFWLQWRPHLAEFALGIHDGPVYSAEA